jgi:inosose dehydratase
MGINYVEVNSVNFLERYHETMNILNKSSLEISCICHFCNFESDPDVTQARRILDIAAENGVTNVLFIPGNISCEEKREYEIRQMIDCLKQLGEYGVLKNITICLEDFDGENSPLSGKGLVRFLQECKLVQCAFDTGNFLFWEEDVFQYFELLKDRIAHVHLKNRSCIKADGEIPMITIEGNKYYSSPVGSGVIRMEDIIKKLKGLKYDGIYAIEHYGAQNQLDYIKKSVDWLNQSGAIQLSK